MKIRFNLSRHLPELPPVTVTILYGPRGDSRYARLVVTYQGRTPKDIIRSFERDRKKDRMVTIHDVPRGEDTAFPARSIIDLQVKVQVAE